MQASWTSRGPDLVPDAKKPPIRRSLACLGFDRARMGHLLDPCAGGPYRRVRSLDGPRDEDIRI